MSVVWAFVYVRDFNFQALDFAYNCAEFRYLDM